MKDSKFEMKPGFTVHSTATVATVAVTIAGIAATSENRAMTRACRRAPALEILRARRRRNNASPMIVTSTTTISASPARMAMTIVLVGTMGVKPPNTVNVASARTIAKPTATAPNRFEAQDSPVRSGAASFRN